MANLSEDTCMEAAPVTYSGVDILGPISIRKRKSELKHNFYLFAPVSIRVAIIIDADPFIIALHRSQTKRSAVY